MHIFAVFILLLLLPYSKAQLNCADAPSASLKIVCSQIRKWDEGVRAAVTHQSKVAFPPGIASVGFAADLAPIARTAFQCMSLGCLCNYMGGSGIEGSNQCTLPDGQPLNKVIRREYRTLSDEERERYHTAVRQIKANGEYDRLATTHAQFAEAGGAHSGPAFMPWHREYIKRFEIALRKVDPSVSIPYWDSVLDNNLPRPTDSMMWTDNFMGASDSAGNVISGPFAQWRTLTGRANILRRVGVQGSLFRESEVAFSARQNRVEQVLAFTAPRQGCPVETNFNVLEFSHGNIHIYVGGDMLDQSTSANDPIFFLHHAFVDMVWEIWRQQMQNRASRARDYPADHQLCANSAHFGSSLMRPFEPMRNVDGLTNEYTDNLYEYESRPVCPSCGGSKYLFCMRTGGPGRCASKIRPGGSCQGLNDSDGPCFNGQCQSGICVAVRELPKPERSPLRPTPSSSAAQETCFNEHECCSVWQDEGECSRNVNYMRLWCKASCGVCRPHYDLSVECSDRHINCDRWARGGECSNNAQWMSENCRQSCNKCARTRAETCGAGVQRQPTISRPAIQRAPPTSCNSPGCFNENICCPILGLQGQCASNATWMACNCRVSCGFCSTTDYNYGTCEDYHPDCAAWSNGGECESNPWMLENCRRSCQSCLSAGELRRVCRSGSVGRSIGRRPPPMDSRSPLEVPSQFQRRPRPPIGSDFDLATGVNIPGLLSLRWGRDANQKGSM